MLSRVRGAKRQALLLLLYGDSLHNLHDCGWIGVELLSRDYEWQAAILHSSPNTKQLVKQDSLQQITCLQELSAVHATVWLRQNWQEEPYCGPEQVPKGRHSLEEDYTQAIWLNKVLLPEPLLQETLARGRPKIIQKPHSQRMHLLLAAAWGFDRNTHQNHKDKRNIAGAHREPLHWMRLRWREVCHLSKRRHNRWQFDQKGRKEDPDIQS